MIVTQTKLNITIKCKGKSYTTEVTRFANIYLRRVCSYTLTTDKIQIYIPKTLTQHEAFQNPIDTELLHENFDIQLPEKAPEPLELFARTVSNHNDVLIIAIVNTGVTSVIIAIIVALTIKLIRNRKNKVNTDYL